LMVIKTIATFASRPMRWFAILSTPLLVGSLVLFVRTFLDLTAHDGHFSLPIAGTGVIFLASAIILLCSGALAELIYSYGDLRDREFLRLTQSVRERRKEH